MAILRQQANKITEDTLAKLKAVPVTGAVQEGGQGTISKELKNKIQNAITVMQEGLVERDTEVAEQNSYLFLYLSLSQVHGT